MRKKPLILVAFLMMLYITPMIFTLSYGFTASPTQPNIAKDFSLSASGWYDASWDYRKSISINGSSGAGTNYQVKINVGMESLIPIGFDFVSRTSDVGAHQSVAYDGTYFYTTYLSIANNISKYDSDWNLVDSHNWNSDPPLVKTQLNGIWIKDGKLYYGASNYNNATRRSWIVIYDAATLDYIGYEGPLEDAGGEITGWGEGASFHDGYWWFVWDDRMKVTKFDEDWNFVAEYDLDYSITGSHYYQSSTWVGDYFLANIHSGSTPNTCDVYYWNGTGFEMFKRLDRPSKWTTQNNYLAPDGETLYWAERDYQGDAAQDNVIKSTLILPDVAVDYKAQIDFDDILFTDEYGNTVLDHWIEDYTDNAIATFWVEVADDLDSDVIIYMYYGNSEAADTSNGDNTFLDYADFEEGNLSDINFTLGSPSAVSTFARKGTYSVKCFSTSSSYNEAGWGWNDEHTMGDVAYTGWFYDEDLTNGDSDILIRVWGSDAPNKLGAGIQNTMDISLYNYHNYGYNYYDTVLSRNEGWHRFECLPSGGGNVSFYIDGQFIFTIGTPTEVERFIGTVYKSDGATVLDGYFDDMFIRKCIVDEPEILTFGDEETVSWHIVGVAIIVFFVPVFTGAFDALLIILGLIMIPASTLYLVKGGKDEMSSDKLFYFLIVFVIGWGLFLGGIMP